MNNKIRNQIDNFTIQYHSYQGEDYTLDKGLISNNLQKFAFRVQVLANLATKATITLDEAYNQILSEFTEINNIKNELND